MNKLKNWLRNWLEIKDEVAEKKEPIYKFQVELDTHQEPVLTREESKQLTLIQAEEFKKFVNSTSFPTFEKFFKIAIENRINAWLSQAGEVDSFTKQLRTEINLLMLIKNAPLDFIQAGENAKKDKQIQE